MESEPRPTDAQSTAPLDDTTAEERDRRRRGDAARPVTRRPPARCSASSSLSAVAFLYFVLPKIAGLHDTWNRIDEGDPAGSRSRSCSSSCSFLGYVGLFRTVFVRGGSRIDWRESYQITMAGLAATRLFAAAGAGGIALTAWALRRSGMERRIVACRMIAFMVLLYAVYMLALVIVGLGLCVRPVPRRGALRDDGRPGDLRRA